ncbi:ZIP zinc/iron transport family [Hortaea werneckii]|nr:ZIP zinc/iron transport family [Hortaea werneckii]
MSISQDAASSGNQYLQDPTSVNLDTADPRDIICYLNKGENEYNGQLGARVSAIFVVLVVSTALTFFPVVATRAPRLKIPLYVYLFARYFGSGVIIATAFIHLLQPSYEEIGSNTCVGMTGGWAGYAWPPAIAMASAMFVFLLDFAAERYVEKKYGFMHGATGGERAGGIKKASADAGMLSYQMAHRPSGLADHHQSHQFLHSADQDGTGPESKKHDDIETASITTEKEQAAETSFKQQIAAFLILEFGVIFHSVIIGLTLGTAGDEFATLYPVIVFHQTFEGLGIGARLSAIGFPKRLRWMPWMLCTIYGLTTPIAIAIGLGVRHTYNPASNTANIVSGVLDAVSAGILLFTGFVELLARDFLFNPDRTHDDRQLTFMIVSVLLGAGLMALLGKKNGLRDQSGVKLLLTSPFQANGHRLRNDPGNGAVTIWSASPVPRVDLISS